jgi:hypothetical protein
MESILFEMFYESLLSISLTFIATIIPFLGALWIYKKTTFYNTEAQIFRIGTDICDVLKERQKANLALGHFTYSYIDKHLPKIGEQNRNKALHKLLKKCIKLLIFGEEMEKNKLNINEDESAKVVLAIAYERYESLVPENIKWSGKGIMYSMFGEDIHTSDSYFPFGSKCYAQWINEFSSKYNDLWVCTNNTNRLVEQFSECSESFDQNDIGDWLKQVENDIEKIHKLHSKLVLNVQLIDNNINYEGFKSSIIANTFYIISIGLMGYFIPKFFYEAKALGANELFIYSLATLSLMLCIFNRLSSKPKSDANEQKQIFIPKLLNNLKELKVANLQLNYLEFDHLIAIRRDLQLSYFQTRQIKQLVEKIKKYNQLAQKFEEEFPQVIIPLFLKYKSKNKDVGGISIQVLEISDVDFDLDKTIEFIKTKDTNVSFSIRRLSGTRDLHKIYLKDLTSEQRDDLCEQLKDIRRQTNELSSYVLLKNTQSSLIKTAQKLESKFSKYTLN